MHKTGSIFDILLIVVFVFILGIGFLIFHSVYGGVADAMINTSVINASSDAVSVLQQSKNIADKMDYIVFAVFIGLILGAMIVSWFIPTNPIWMFIFLVVDVVIVIISAVMSYVWGVVSNNPTFAPTLLKFPITDNILTNFPFYITVICLLSLAVMYGKPYIAGEAQQ